jgi:CubicO group peptidase (beta-lactamase class C family)
MGRLTSRSGWTLVVGGVWLACTLLVRAPIATAGPADVFLPPGVAPAAESVPPAAEPVVSPQADTTRAIPSPTEQRAVPSPTEQRLVASPGDQRVVPLPADQRVTLANWLQPPHERWAMTHLEQLTTVATVDRGEQPATYLGPLWLDLQRFQVSGPDGRVRTFEQAFEEQDIDSLLLWHGGSLRLERYRDGHSARDRHAMLTATSAFTGLLAEMLIAEKQFDDMRLVTFYLPELKGSAWDKASVREALDMEVGLDFREIYGDPWSDFGQLMAASRVLGPPDAMRVAPSITEYLHGVRPQGEPGMDYQPASPNVEVLGWIMHRVTGKPVAQLFQEKLYKDLGADRDAYFVTDAAGMSSASAGLGITARDLLRLGVMLAQRGQHNMKQIVSPEVVQKIEAGGERRHATPGNEQAPFYSYKSHWHIYHPAQTFAAWGIHGQYLFIAPEQQVVLAMQSSHPDAWGPHVALAEAFFHALVEHVQR